MIDYIKILLKDVDTERLLNLPQIEFKFEVFDTGEYSKKKIADYHFCKIVVYESGVTLFAGSIHKMWNSINGVKAPNFNKQKEYKGFNGNQFGLNSIFALRNHLQKLFDCSSEQMIFQNIEFGLNAVILFNPQTYIKGLLYHHGKQFEYKFNHHFAQAKHERYFLKIYNKSNQYMMDEYVIRAELKVIKMEDLKSTGIKSFADINVETLRIIYNLLLKRFNEVVYYDYTMSTEILSELEKQKLSRYSNPRYWIIDLKPKNRDYNKSQLKSYINNYSDKLHQKIVLEMTSVFGIINQEF